MYLVKINSLYSLLEDFLLSMIVQAVLVVQAKMELEIGEQARELSCIRIRLLALKLQANWPWLGC